MASDTLDTPLPLPSQIRSAAMPHDSLDQSDYTTLAEFRYLIRCFLQFSEERAKSVGLTARQHQALLVIKGYGKGAPVTVGTLADRLRIKHHSAVELANRLAESGLIERLTDQTDQRKVLLQLTLLAQEHLAALSAAHRDELSRIKPMLRRVLDPADNQQP
ncbi:MarR family winged helix-turn-helix transcriptional regulator [Advenella kashmirensis]